MQSINNHIMRTKSSIDMKQTALERKFDKLLLYAIKINLTYAQFCLLLPCLLMYIDEIPSTTSMSDYVCICASGELLVPVVDTNKTGNKSHRPILRSGHRKFFWCLGA